MSTPLNHAGADYPPATERELYGNKAHVRSPEPQRTPVVLATKHWRAKLAAMQRRHLLLLPLMVVAGTRGARAGAPPTAYEQRELRTPDGTATSLAHTARGTRLLVVVMKSVHCPVCVAQLRRLEQMSTELARFGVTTVGLSHEPFAQCGRAQRRAKLATVVLSDPKVKVIRTLGLWRDDFGHPMPALVLFDRCGSERGRLVGRRPGQRPEPALLELLRSLERDPERCPKNSA